MITINSQKSSKSDAYSFQWIPFYEEFARKLLKYRDKRSELLDFIYNKDKIASNFTTYLHDSDNEPMSDIDPFTVMGIFNRGIKEESRTKIAAAFKDFLQIEAETPVVFDGIPIVSTNTARFFAGKEKRGENDIDNLWQLFETALNNHDEPEKIENIYNVVITQPSIDRKITYALSWLLPHTYMALDLKYNDFLKDYGIKISNVNTSFKSYHTILNKIRHKMETGEIPAESFPELSYKAYMAARTQEGSNVVETESEFGSDFNYWMLCANPKIWSMLNWKIGEEIDYTLFAENGNKRRIFQNFLDAKVGDKVVCYQSSVVVAFAEISKVETNDAFPDTDKKIWVVKRQEVKNPIELADIRQNPNLSEMQGLPNFQGSFFRLTEKEYNTLVTLSNAVKSVPYTKTDFLDEVFMSAEEYDELESLLRNKKNIILQGAPGVGKTFCAKRLAYSMMGEKDESRVEMIQFHQNYSYEDFIMGYKPDGGTFELKNGIFYDFCTKAAENPDKDFFFIIDEINRGNLSKIFGELLMLVEKDYRNEKIKLAYTDEKFSVPENIYLIGMMNTADRSLAMIDYALRRRFSFFNMKPGFGSDGFGKYRQNIGNPHFDRLIDKVIVLNKEIADDDSLGSGFEIGHSYFCGREDLRGEEKEIDGWLKSVINYDIVPMLDEYWFDNKSKAEKWADELNAIFHD